ncbi:hypothetical protein [Pseudoduganella sp. HUAS MS19]
MRLEWPMFGLVDDRSQSTGYVGLHAPAANAAQAQAILSFTMSHRLLGFCSYVDFPAGYRLSNQQDYESLCFAWCHCFRNPDQFFSPGRRLLLLSHSDFIDYTLAAPRPLLGELHSGRDYDFAYVCQPGSWKEKVKNWGLALRCLPVLCDELGLRGALVGRDVLDGPPLRHPHRLTMLPELPWGDLMRLLGCSRFLFLPNELDASPRLLCEALCMDTPVLVNRRILGGWKYVNGFTGAFFDDECNVAQGARDCLEHWTSPRRWYIANSGPIVSGRRLARFLACHDKNLAHVRTIHLSDTL